MARFALARDRRLWAILAAASLAAVITTTAVLEHSPVVHGPATHSVSLAALAHRPHSATAHTALDSAAPIHDALFIGASYTQGLGAQTPNAGYAYLTGREEGWDTQVNGVSGTGYLNPGPRGHQTFAERLAHLPSHPHPDLVVFQGGRNDVGYPTSQLRAAVIDTVALTRKRFGPVQIVLLGPIPAEVPVPPNQIAVENTLRAAAASCQVDFVDPIAQHWITPQNERGYAGHVPAHPDNEGYAYIAQRLADDLDTLLAQHSTN